MNQEIIDLVFEYVNDPFLGKGYASIETYLRIPNLFYSRTYLDVPYYTYKWFIHKSTYTGLWNIIYMPTGHRESVVNIVDINEKFEEMKKTCDML